MTSIFEKFFNFSIISKNIVIIVFAFRDFINAKYLYFKKLLKKLRTIVRAIIVVHFRSFVVKVTSRIIKIFSTKLSIYFVKWVIDRNIFRIISLKFYNDTINYRRTQIYRSFLLEVAKVLNFLITQNLLFNEFTSNKQTTTSNK